MYSFNPSLKNTLGLYVFESLRQEKLILFEKSQISLSPLLSSVAINVDLPNLTGVQQDLSFSSQESAFL